MLSYERYLVLVGGRARVVAALDRQVADVGVSLGEDEALEIANRELHAMRRERDAAGP